MKNPLVSERAEAGYALALLLAALYLLHLHTVDFFVGKTAMFTQGDAAQHVSGWLFYRDDEWRFPLLLTQRMNAPEGASIAFTDSIPLMALPMKLIRAVLPEGFHYIGLWHGIAHVLQALAAVYLIRALGARSLFAAFIAAGFALTWPEFLMRFGHTSLTTHALIIFSFGVYFRGRSYTLSPRAAGWRFILIICTAMMIHPYLLAMCYAIFLAHLIDQAITQRSIRSGAIFLLISVALITLLALVLGYFGASSQTAGFGTYSMNLMAPFCGGQLWNCNMDGTGGQGEGYNYLGAGFLALCPLALWISRNRLCDTVRNYPALLAMTVAVTIYALSNRVFLSTHLVFEYPVPALLQRITNTFRCSGRFFWVVSYLLLFVVLSRVLVLRKAYLQILITATLLLQIYDMGGVRKIIMDEANKPAAAAAVDWRRLLQDVDVIEVYPVYGCGEAYTDFQLRYQLIAALHGKLINTSYVARASNDCGAKNTPFENDFVPGRLYVEPAKWTGGMWHLPKGFARAADRHECVIFEQDMLCLPGHDADTLAQQHENLKAVASLEKTLQLQLPPLFLPTRVGIRQGNTLVAQPGNAGYLSFGPFTTIAEGNYGVRIQFTANKCSQAVVGYWDAVSDGGSRTLGRGDIRIDQGQSTAEGSFVATTSPRNFEIRTFYNGVCDFRLEGIALTKLDEK